MVDITIENETATAATPARTKLSKSKKASKRVTTARKRKASKKTSKRVPLKAKSSSTRSGASAQPERSNKKAEVIAMMRRPNGATLSEIVAATGWQKHTVRGFVSILGKNGAHKIESLKNSSGERTYKVSD